MSAIGSPSTRVDGHLKVTGRAVYAAEFAPVGLVYAAIVASRIAAGRILTLSTENAERAPGVLAVLTYKNADVLPYKKSDERPVVDPASGEQLHVLQDADIRFSGQPVGLVIAETQSQAEYGASLVRVTYDEEPSPRTRFDQTLSRPASEEAAKRGRGPEFKRGDTDRALLSAVFRVDQTYVQPREHHNAMEPHATVAMWEGERLTLWSKTQWVGNVRDEIARVFGISPDLIHVVNPFVGGAFGSALRTWPHVTLAAMAARMVSRPVRLELSRRELYYSIGFRPSAVQRVVLAAKADGELVALIHEVTAQTSTYEEFADATLDVPASTYACANRRMSYRLVDMNTNTPCPMRGPGHTTGLIAQEIAMDELATLLRLDPIELRLRNFAERNPKTDLPWSSNALRQCYRIGAERFGWSERVAEPRSMRAGRDLVGFGMATAMNPAPRYPAQASATIFDDGNVVVRSATSDMGPGTYTAMTQVAADTLGVEMARVRFELGDTALPEAKEHGGSTTMASVGSAVQSACGALRAKLEELGLQPGADAANAPELLHQASLTRLDATGSAAPGDTPKKYSSYGFGAVFTEVRVDPDFGTVRVKRIIGAYDAGRIVNPKLAHSQCIGGMVGGIGMALLEETDWDAHLGRVVNANLAEYLLPVCADIDELEALFVPAEDTIMNPLGVKGLAELALCGVAPAIANAVWHATGKRMRELPITPDKLLMFSSTSESQEQPAN